MLSLRETINEHNLLRMIGWLPVGVAFYGASIWIGTDHPQIQLLCWKLGHVCTFSWIGYWVARQVSGRLQRLRDVDTIYEAIVYAARILARAILVAAALLASNGL